MVVQFVAFVGAYRDPGTPNPWVAAVLVALFDGVYDFLSRQLKLGREPA
jgi:hypothetical protein